ncbi:ABC transporter substrate-binding protein [Microbacterium abyssi]|uniref:ABC transporter substrate-binding protein n=1 Tax=Microbacterium abyssi TaxID=2782166 RepID=UPI001887DB99|nr:ABC transporter substrate-binding protein [Microbacterium sp. A18JL241]
MRGRRRVAAVGAAAGLAVALTACAPALPESVVPGSAAVVGWSGEFTSANAAASPTRGNVDIAEAIRADFGDVIDGEFVADEGFGTVTITREDPFTVRYDLAEPVWSDGIPLDAADLLLGWAAASGHLPLEDEAQDGGEGADAEHRMPAIDEFARAIEVTFPQPIMQWQSAVSAPVPAHVVGARAFGLDDPMQAKQAVIAAIEDGDEQALESIATVWHEGFEITDGDDASGVLSSGPYTVDRIEASDDGQSVSLAPNPSYRGLESSKIARIDLVPPGDDPIAAIGDVLDVAQVAPTAANRAVIRELERTDHVIDIQHDGTMWALLLNPSGVFGQHAARTAFIHASPATAMSDGGAGEWTSAYTATTSMVSAPGSRTYDIVNEDSGFTETLGTPGDDPALEREASGHPAGTRVCVLYDRGSEFAAGAFNALRAVAADSGWSVADCGSDDFDAAVEQRDWNAVIARVPIPQSPDGIADQWGAQGAASITGDASAERDALIAQLARTPDVYEARDVTAQIEATIVRSAIAVPIAVNPRLSIIDRDVTGAAPRSGAEAPLTHGLTRWAVVQ